jgi:ferredoxin-NADP reductase
MISRDSVEFVISARDGFTKDLFEAACEKPGRKVRAGLEGAYGHVPAIMGYERVVLFAGGSGATFTFALAVEWAKKQDVEAMKSLEFVWSVRTAGKSSHERLWRLATVFMISSLTPPTAQLEGFTAEIAILEAHPRINIRVHITKPTKALSEKPASLSSVDETSETAVLDTEAVKIEATAEVASLDEILPLYTVPGRPDVYSTVHRIASECQARERILVAACGPAGLSDSVRDAVKSCTSVDGPSLDLHLEAFGW